ncbi:MAG: DUF484 family protein [Acetobacteraceae bacterium]|nr:DUF484 family protein [Acetobacteraceae bacterium]
MTRAAPLADDAAALVEAYLAEHPRFLAERPALYAQQEPPTRVHGETLADHMQARLTAGAAREAALSRQIEGLLANGRANMAAAARIQRAVLALVAAREPASVLPALADLLGVEVVSLCAERPAPPGFRTLEPGEIARLLPAGRDVVLRRDPADTAALHGEAHPLVASDALLRLCRAAGEQPALLAIGAREAEKFQPGQATDLLQFLAASVDAALRRR